MKKTKILVIGIILLLLTAGFTSVIGISLEHKNIDYINQKLGKNNSNYNENNEEIYDLDYNRDYRIGEIISTLILQKTNTAYGLAYNDYDSPEKLYISDNKNSTIHIYSLMKDSRCMNKNTRLIMILK